MLDRIALGYAEWYVRKKEKKQMKSNLILLLVVIFIIFSQVFKIWWPTQSFEGADLLLEPENVPILLLAIVFVFGFKYFFDKD